MVDGALEGLPPGLVAVPDGVPEVVLQDAEGTPVALVLTDGAVRAIQPFTQPPVRSRRRTAAQVRQWLRGAPAVAVPVAGPLTTEQVRQAVARAAGAGSSILWLALVGDGWGHPEGSRDGSPHALFRAMQQVADAEGGLAVPLALPKAHADLLAGIARAYGADQLVDLPGEAAPSGALHPVFGRPPDLGARRSSGRGVVVFLTGLSGSGKSTIARGLHERLLEDGGRPVTLLDGDQVRRLLSAGLGFSRADRDLNIRRIGYVAAEVARHGGLAICAPIAPFEGLRAEVRSMVEAVGGDLVLVYVATPLAECERRDRKGLYAQARRGEIADFTGISSPYEPPTDAELVLDTTGVEVDHDVGQVWDLLVSRGHLPARAYPPARGRTHSS